MTQMWVNITCFYPICQFPKTKKQMSEDLSTVSTPFPLTQKKQNHKHTYSEAKIWHIDNHHGIFHRKGLELEVAWWHPGNLEAHHVSIRGADVTVTPMEWWPLFLSVDGWLFFVWTAQRVDKKHGERKRKKWLFLGRNVLRGFWVEDDRGYVLLSTVLTWWLGREMLWLHLLFVVV